MSFLELPAELQLEVFSYLSNTDLKAARAVNTSCRDNASPWLFRSIIACARYQAMGAFQNISLHPVYRNYVKEIVFDATEFDEMLATHERSYQAATLEVDGLKDLASWTRHARFKQYQLLYREQEEMKGDILLQTVARALEWMPHVHSIVHCSQQRQVPAELKEMREIIPRAIHFSRYGKLCLRSGRIAYRSENAFHLLVGAIGLAQYSSIRELRVQPHYDAESHTFTGSLFYLEDFLFAQPSYLESGKCFFRNLHKVDLSLNVRCIPSTHECLTNMRALLSEAKGLHHLRLHLLPRPTPQLAAAVSRRAGGHSHFACFGLTTEWPELQTVDFGGIYAIEDELRNMASRWKDTLTSMKFTQCVMTMGKWSNLIDDVVYSTNMATFMLDHVNEEFVGEVPFEEFDREKARLWRYVGEVKENVQGERYFDERPGKKSVYAWRDLLATDKGPAEVK